MAAEDDIDEQRFEQALERHGHRRQMRRSSGPNRTFAAMASFEDKKASDMECHLEEDMYTNAFVSMMDTNLDGHGLHKRFCPFFLMMGVILVQMLAITTVNNYVHDSMINKRTNAFDTAFMMVVGTNATMPLDLSHAICGEFEQFETRAGSKMSRVALADGTVYSATEDFPLFYATKQPENNWFVKNLMNERSIISDAEYVITDGMMALPVGYRVNGYALLFIMLICVLLCSVIIESRQVYTFGLALRSLPIVQCGTKSFYYDSEEDTFSLVGLTWAAKLVGYGILVSRVVLAAWLAFVGCHFLMWTTVKLDLIMNSLALVFIFDLDNLVYTASVSLLKQRFISELEPIRYKATLSKDNIKAAKTLMPLFVITIIILSAICMRYCQIVNFTQIYETAATLCLFGGPVPYQARDLLAPVPGYCESLLSAQCAPEVTGPGASHGHCLVTDRSVFRKGDWSMYLDARPQELEEAAAWHSRVPGRDLVDKVPVPGLRKHHDRSREPLFENMYSKTGKRNSVEVWGKGNAELYKRRMWMDNPNQDKVRKYCLNLYQPKYGVDEREVDMDSGEEMNGAPFMCNRDELYNAVFYAPRQFLQKFNYNSDGDPYDVTEEKANIKEMMWQLDLWGHDVQVAMDNCHKHPPTKTYEQYEKEQGDEEGGEEDDDDEEEEEEVEGIPIAPSPAAAFAPASFTAREVPNSNNFPKDNFLLKRRRNHHMLEISRERVEETKHAKHLKVKINKSPAETQ